MEENLGVIWAGFLDEVGLEEYCKHHWEKLYTLISFNNDNKTKVDERKGLLLITQALWRVEPTSLLQLPTSLSYKKLGLRWREDVNTRFYKGQG